MSGKKKLLKFLGIGTVGAIFLGLLVYIVMVRPLQIRGEKQNFALAEAKLDDLAKQIEQTVGKPDEIKKNKSCGYASRVSGKGPRGCSVQIGMVFSVPDSVAANEIRDKIDRALPLSAFDITYTTTKQFSNLENTNQIQRSGYDLFNRDIYLGCSVGLVYAMNSNADLLIQSKKQPENVSIELSCGGPAMAEYSPVKN